MKILIVFHGNFPDGEIPSSGVALRALTNGLGLTAHGVDVCYASRRRDLWMATPAGRPPIHPFEGRAELNSLVRLLEPDLILVEGTDELTNLRECVQPIIVDLFAPRVLEAQWEGLDASREVLTLLDGLARADYFMVTTERQRYYYLGLLPLAGIDCRDGRIATVPLSILPGTRRRQMSRSPTLMTGGVAWPWQDPSWALTRVVAKMEELERGRLNLLRGPYPLAGKQGAVPSLPVETSPRVDCRGLLGYDAMMDLLSSAWCFVDLMAPNLERELALSFRQLDALAAGLPMLMGDYAPLAPLVAEYGAGWVVSFGDEEALDQALVEILADKKEVRRRGRNTRRLANDRFLCTKTIESLMEILANPSRRQGLETLTAALSRRSSEAQAQEIDLAALKLKKADLEADLGKKTLEVKTLAQQVRTLTDSLGKLAGSLEGALYLEQLQVERFQSETEEARGDQASQRRALEAARREAAKKQRELEALIDVRDRLEADIATLRMQGGKARRRADEATAEAARLSGKLELLQEEVAARNLELASLEAERDKKQVELERAWTVRDVLVGEQARLERLVRESEVRLLEAEEGRVGYKKKVQALEAQLGEDRKQLAMQQESLERGAAEIRRLSEKLLVAEGEIARLATAGGAIGTFRGIVVSGLSRRGKKA